MMLIPRVCHSSTYLYTRPYPHQLVFRSGRFPHAEHMYPPPSNPDHLSSLPTSDLLVTPSLTSSPPPSPEYAPGCCPTSSACLCSSRQADPHSKNTAVSVNTPALTSPISLRVLLSPVGRVVGLPWPSPACSDQWLEAAAAGRQSGAPGPGTGGRVEGQTWWLLSL